MTISNFAANLKINAKFETVIYFKLKMAPYGLNVISILTRFLKIATQFQNVVFYKWLVAHATVAIIFANTLDPEQDRQNVGSDLDPNHLMP